MRPPIDQTGLGGAAVRLVLTAAVNWYRAIDVGLVAGVGRITLPTLFVWSTEDVALGPRRGERRSAAADRRLHRATLS